MYDAITSVSLLFGEHVGFLNSYRQSLSVQDGSTFVRTEWEGT